MKKGIIYDFDGVICDSVQIKTNAFIKLYSKYDKSIIDKVVKYHEEHGGISRFKKIKFYHENFLKKKISKEEINILASKFSKYVVGSVINSNYIKNAYEFIKKNSNIYSQFICTGTPQSEIEVILKRKKIKSSLL